MRYLDERLRPPIETLMPDEDFTMRLRRSARERSPSCATAFAAEVRARSSCRLPDTEDASACRVRRARKRWSA